jgi:hypothetical protein
MDEGSTDADTYPQEIQMWTSVLAVSVQAVPISDMVSPEDDEARAADRPARAERAAH